MKRFIIFLILILFSCKKLIPSDVYDPLEDPRNISRNKGCSVGSYVEVTPNGDVHIVWIDEEERLDWHFRLLYKSRIDGKWSDISVLSDTTDERWVTYLGVACDGRGVLHLLYLEELPGEA